MSKSKHQTVDLLEMKATLIMLWQYMTFTLRWTNETIIMF